MSLPHRQGLDGPDNARLARLRRHPRLAHLRDPWRRYTAGEDIDLHDATTEARQIRHGGNT